MPLLTIVDPIYLTFAMIAWFLQMGLHEGGHAIVADKFGDPIPRMYGRVTVNPFRHIEWNNFNSVLMSAILPLATAMTFGIPLGMASVPISPRHTTANHAKIALAGPLGSFLAGVIGLGVWFALAPMLHLDVEPRHVVQSHSLYLGCRVIILTSLLYGVFNLVPIPPLDGSNIAYHYMNQNGRNLMDQIRPYGFIIIIIAFWVFNIGDPVFGWIFHYGNELMFAVL